MPIPFLNNIIIKDENHIQFTTSAGANAGKIDQDGNDLVLTNAVGDVLLGDGSSDVFIGDGTNNVDIIFEQSGAIKGDGGAVTLTIGGANTTLNLENPNINGSLSLSDKLIFTGSSSYIVFDYEPTTGSNAEYSSEVPLLKVDRAGTELTILSRLTNNGALAIGTDDTVAITAGDTKSVIKANLNYPAEEVVLSAEGGFRAYGFPNNDTTWSNRNEFRFRSESATATDNGLYIGDGSSTQFIDLSRNLKNIGTLSLSGSITMDGTSFTKESVFITRTPTVGTDSDWDDFTQQGTYGVASSSGAQFTGDNRPITAGGIEPDYRYGHLVVTEDSSSQGIQQTYYPHSGTRVFFRTGWNNSSWTNWAILWTDRSDGSGSGLDADLLDGNQGTAYFRNNYTSGGDLNTDTASGIYRFNNTESNRPGSITYGTLVTFNNVSDTGFQLVGDYHNTGLYWRGGNSSTFNGSGTNTNWFKIWHDGNDGASSGLDADKLDGQEGSYYLDYGNFSNTPTIPTNNNQLTNGAGYITAAQVTGDNLGNHTATQDLDIGDNALINDGATVFYDRTSPEIDYYDYSKLELLTDSIELHSPGEFIFSGADPYIYIKKPSSGAFLNGNQNVMKLGLIPSFGPGLEAVDTTFANLNTDLHFIVQKAGSQYEALKISGDGDVGSDSQVYIKDNLSVTKRIGIGVTSPQADLHIEDAGNSSSGIRIEAVGSANTDTVNMHFQGQAGNAPFYISRAQTGGAEIQIQADGDLILNGTNGDNVGIGTTVPQQKLHVSNNILCGGNLYFNTGTSNYIKGTGGGLEWYTNTNKIVDITYGGDVEVTNNLDLDNAKLLSWGALGGTTATTYITGADNLTNGGSRISLVGNFNYGFSNATEGHIVFKNSNNNGTTSGTVGLVADIVTDSTATGSIATNIRFGRASNMQYGYNRYTGSIEYISTNQTSGEKMTFKCAQYAFLQANGSPSSGIDSIKIGGNTNNQIGYIDLWGDSGSGKPFFNIQDTRYQPATSLSNPVVRIQNNFHSTNSRYQIVFQRFSSTSSIRGSIATNNSGTTYNTTSDYRLKTDAKDFNALDLVKQIPVYDFKWKNIDNRDYGCFAHELGEVIPNAVHGEKDALTEDGDKDYQQADYSKLVPVLLKAIKELEAKVAALESNQ